jgi:hypothetical protein
LWQIQKIIRETIKERLIIKKITQKKLQRIPRIQTLKIKDKAGSHPKNLMFL